MVKGPESPPEESGGGRTSPDHARRSAPVSGVQPHGGTIPPRPEEGASAARGTGRRLPRIRRSHAIVLFMASLGPGLITANAGNDAGGITTYSQAGAAYGYQLLWVFPLILISLCVVQEMAARMGAATGKGL